MSETGQMIAGIAVLVIILAPAAIIIFAGILNAFGSAAPIPIILFCAIAAVSGFGCWLIYDAQHAEPSASINTESTPDECERYPGPYGC